MTESMTPQLAPRDRCTGCGACMSGCPKGAIHMLPDREGFLYPTVTDACVQCGHCTHICPVLKRREERPEPAAFAVWNPDDEVRLASSAGGVFTPLAEYVLETGGVVFGAATDDHLHVAHIAVMDKDELSRLRGAKLVQSELGDSYAKVRLYLDQGRMVLFSGTPCQVDGLYRFLGEYPEKLVTCDFACHGVPSPGVWEHIVRSMAYVKRKTPVAVEFCAKLAGDRERRFRVQFNDGSVFDAPLLKSEYGRGIDRALFFRKSCHSCTYACTQHPADLTLAACMAAGKDFYPDERKKGLSMLLVNTPKGAHIFDTLPLKRTRCEVSDAVAANPALCAPVEIPPDRATFFAAYAKQPFQEVRNRFLALPKLSYQVANHSFERLKRLLKRKEK
ncbi:MAG: Coenzyme F420 hydrogenase/dehydrogenase, beta subunit C-terminal domain [Clostridiales bacterium]|nr:Coenzyme F420 hydrogenase/dehydrogenase, beta subunit C-terminal domain [Candidatus Cacconaster stercorequi]